MKVMIYGLTSQDMVEIDLAFRTMENIFGGFCISLTELERIAMPSMGDQRLAFTMKAFGYAQQYPHLLPGTVQLPKLIRVHREWTDLNTILLRMRTIGQMLDDGVMVTGVSYYAFGRLFYGSVQNHMEDEIPGITTVNDDLSRQFILESGPNLDDEPLVDGDLRPGNDGNGTGTVAPV